MKKFINGLLLTFLAVSFLSVKYDAVSTIYFCHEQNCLNTVNRCDLDIVKLINNDTLVFVHSSEHFGEYEEWWGKLRTINDSIYYVKCFRHIEQNGTMPYYGHEKDTLTFYCDSICMNEQMTVKYKNGKVNYIRIGSTVNHMAIDKQSFNSTDRYAMLSFGYKHPIVNEIVELRIPNNTDIYFQSDDPKQYDFYVIISSMEISTLNRTSVNNAISGPQFSLKRMTNTNALSRGRKLR